MTHEEAVQEARRRWGPDGYAWYEEVRDVGDMMCADYRFTQYDEDHLNVARCCVGLRLVEHRKFLWFKWDRVTYEYFGAGYDFEFAFEDVTRMLSTGLAYFGPYRERHRQILLRKYQQVSDGPAVALLEHRRVVDPS